MSLLNFDEFKWRAMTATINQIKKPARLLQDLVFKKSNTNASETIDVDVQVGGRNIAPFVSPVEGGIVVDKLGREMRSIKAPRIRIKKAFSAQELFTTRTPGSGFYASSGDISAYRKKKVGQELADLKNRIVNTTEWMCAQALTGTLTVDQENVSFQVNYQLPATHKPTLADPNGWNQTGGKIMDDIDEWANLIINAIGVGPDLAVCGKNVVKAIRDNEQVAKLLDNRRVEAGKVGWKATSNYIGNLNGIDLYRYGTEYTDLSGNDQNFIDDNKFILVATGARFSIEYGLILDLEANAQVVSEYFAKSWIEKDPSNLWILAESRPLPVPWQPEAIVYADVIV